MYKTIFIFRFSEALHIKHNSNALSFHATTLRALTSSSLSFSAPPSFRRFSGNTNSTCVYIFRIFRELFLLERKTTSDEMERLEKKLTSSESSLRKELAWKEKAADDVRAAERDRRSAINEADRAAQTAEERWVLANGYIVTEYL